MKKKLIDFRVNENGCFIVTSHRTNGEGYCYFWHISRSVRMHRYIYEQLFGEIQDGLVVRHKCDVRNCINPEHLELGTPKENSLDKVTRGRSAYGEKNGRRKINENQAKEIKQLLKQGHAIQKIADMYGLRHALVWKIATNKTWTHIA